MLLRHEEVADASRDIQVSFGSASYDSRMMVSGHHEGPRYTHAPANEAAGARETEIAAEGALKSRHRSPDVVTFASGRGVAAIAVMVLACGCRDSDITHAFGTSQLEAGGEVDDGAPLGSPVPAPSTAGGANPDVEPNTGRDPPDDALVVQSPVEELNAACGLGTLTAAGGQAIDRKPYLQQVTATSAIVLFTTRETGVRPTLWLTKPSENIGQVVPTELDLQDDTGHQHLARLGDLEPDTTYCYEIEDWLEPVGFRTAPLSGTGAVVRFVAFGDSGGNSRELVRSAMDGVRFDLLLHVGDIAYSDGSLANFETKFFDTYERLIEHLPIFPASGNHEYYTNAVAYRQVFALPEDGAPDGLERWFSYDWADIHFVALDTELVGAKQAAWLERNLQQNSLPWTVVYMHKPPYSSGTHGSSLDVRETFTPIFERFGVQLVLAGHDHDYERIKPIGGVTYVVTGGGGFSIRSVGRSDFTVYSQSVFHFVQAEVRADELSLRAIDTDGKVIDATVIPRIAVARD